MFSTKRKDFMSIEVHTREIRGNGGTVTLEMDNDSATYRVIVDTPIGVETLTTTKRSKAAEMFKHPFVFTSKGFDPFKDKVLETAE